MEDEASTVLAQESLVVLHFTILCFTDVVLCFAFYKLEGKTLHQQTRLQLALLQWSGTESSICLGCACIGEGSCLAARSPVDSLQTS